MKQQKPKVQFTQQMLEALQAAALDNARSLIEEAELLSAHGYNARAYFLAVAGIEEVGKASLAFLARGRNLSAPDVQTTLRRDMDDHAKKIQAGFYLSVLDMKPDEARAEITAMVDRMIALKHGREPSMYVDVTASGTVTSPKTSVRPANGVDCPRLARHCLDKAEETLRTRVPPRTSKIQDRLYTLGSGAVTVGKMQDFWEYFIYELGKLPKPIPPEVTSEMWAQCIVTYHDAYLHKGKTFGAGQRP
jgi:AbiV family abortive infection protein